jgi:methyltransferase (TIGR00027 family)
MREGEASATAQRVAAHRLTFDRPATAYGDPAADDRLAADVAAGVEGGQSGLVRYLAARTAFFDRVVVQAVDAGMDQIVVAAAGYDGRSLRYAKPGVRWFELDHPDTQQDKQARLDRLGIDAAHVAFVAADFTTDPIAARLTAAGLDTAKPTLFTVEGVAVYLDRPVLERLLREMRDAAGPDSRLAISVSVSTDGAEPNRQAFADTVQRLGEPARTTLTADDADALLAGAGWQADRGRPERRAGLVLAAATSG